MECQNCEKLKQQDLLLSEDEKKEFFPLEVRCKLDKDLQSAFNLHERWFGKINLPQEG